MAQTVRDSDLIIASFDGLSLSVRNLGSLCGLSMSMSAIRKKNITEMGCLRVECRGLW